MAIDAGSIALRTKKSGTADSPKFVPMAYLRNLRRCQQVAAICYRVRNGVIEFLLVRTRNERWIFPKGNAEPGLTHAQAAALEAFEEGGVHGRMEEICFTRYVRDKPRARNVSSRSIASEVEVNVHLCEVLWLEAPQEPGRNPTWFPAGKAKRRLKEQRPAEFGTDLARVIDHAVKQIERVRTGSRATLDAPAKVQFIDALRRRS